MILRLGHWWEDVVTLPRDCRVAWRFGGAADVVLTLLERSLFKVLWGGRFLVVRAPTETATTASPAGVAVSRLDPSQVEDLAPVSTAPRMRLFRQLAGQGGVCIVARRGERVVGYVWALHSGSAARSAFLRALPPGLPCVRTLFVSRHERGRGVATAMLVRLAQARHEEGVTSSACCALVRPGNRASLRVVRSFSGGREEVIGRLTQLKLFHRVWAHVVV